MNLCSPDHVSLLVHRTFNVSIPRHHIPSDHWEFEYGPAENDPEFGVGGEEGEGGEDAEKDKEEQEEEEGEDTDRRGCKREDDVRGVGEEGEGEGAGEDEVRRVRGDEHD